MWKFTSSNFSLQNNELRVVLLNIRVLCIQPSYMRDATVCWLRKSVTSIVSVVFHNWNIWMDNYSTEIHFLFFSKIFEDEWESFFSYFWLNGVIIENLKEKKNKFSLSSRILAQKISRYQSGDFYIFNNRNILGNIYTS